MAFGRLERNPGSQPMGEINMTPLIDVMLVLLVIFIITAPLMTSSLKLDLPRTEGGRPSDAPAFIAVAVDAQGQVFVGDDKVERTQLVQRVKDSTELPVAVGFGVSTPEQAATVAGIAALTLATGQWALGRDLMIPAGAIIVTAVLAAGIRLLLEAGHAWRERVRLRGAFAGYVSPQVLREIENGRLAGLAVARRFICVLVLDVRNFTTRSEKESPERIVGMLNALYEEATTAIHAHGGTVDKFMGDGVLAFFGAPVPHTDPCAAGFAAARDILERVHRMGQNLEAAGEAPIEIGIGLSCGEAIVGHVGAAARHAYTAIGDCVNVAARLESLTKDLGHPMVLSHAVVDRLAERDRLVALGVQPLKGHTPHEVYGWR